MTLNGLFGMTRISIVWQVSAPIMRGDLLSRTCCAKSFAKSTGAGPPPDGSGKISTSKIMLPALICLILNSLSGNPDA